MEPAPRGGSNAGKVIAAVLLIGLGLSGLAMSLCGGFFTSVSLYGIVMSDSNGGESAQLGVLVLVGGASLLLGLLVMVLAVVAWKRVVAAQRP